MTADNRSFAEQLAQSRERVTNAITPEARVDALLALHKVLEINLSPLSEQLLVAQEIVQLAESCNYQEGLWWGWYSLSRIYFYQADYALAMYYAQEIYSHVSLNMLDLRFKSANVIGNIYMMLGNFLEALNIFKQLLQFERHPDVVQQIGYIYLNVGAAFMRLQQWENARDETLEGVKRLEKSALSDRLRHIVNGYENLSLIYQKLLDGENALLCAQKAIEYNRSHGLPVTNSALMMMGKSYQLLGEFEKGLHYLQQARQQKIGMEGDFWEGIIEHSLGDLYAQNNRPEEALACLQRAVIIFTRINTPDELSNVHESLYRFYKARGEFEQALHHYEIYHAAFRQFLNGQTETMLRMTNDLHELEMTKLQHKIEEERAKALQHELDERKLNEKRALELSIQREKVRLLSDFVSNTSHDLRTPLTIIQTSAYLARKVQDSERQTIHLDRIEAQSRHLTKLINAMHTMVKLDTEISYEFECFDLNTVVHRILEQENARIQQREMKIHLFLMESPLRIQANQHYVEIALSALIENALLYTPPQGKIEIRSMIEDNLAIIVIQDNGIGISEQDLPHIFERFYKADSARRLNESGLGFGLTMAQKIIEAHRGVLSVESTLNVGSIFRLMLPMGEAC